MGNLKNSQTAENLMKAFAGESQARNRYTFYAKKARDEGLFQIESIFTETADNEREHAKLFYKHLVKNLDPNSMQQLTAAYPVSLFDDTLNNLKSAAAGEHEEWTNLYPTFGNIAEKEGFPEIAQSFRGITLVEKRHEERFLKLFESVKNGTVFKRPGKVLWICKNCGHILETSEAPKKCPVCAHPQEYFQLWVENY